MGVDQINIVFGYKCAQFTNYAQFALCSVKFLQAINTNPWSGLTKHGWQHLMLMDSQSADGI
ncbi:hypothetical protein GCM10007391_20860 [Alteromonas halophila]|uniref:Uncharacterized protein n=1 Tax=Alteromonas halophila TaxID=516698 RepID=A0A918JKS3_9ALTE|nr:hypothetical protein GCM10007391_20860 [Alteromonas halophila]